MKKLFFLILVLVYYTSAFAQNTYKVVVKDSKTKAPLFGATIKITTANLLAKTDEVGQGSIANIPSGWQIIQYSFVGYQTKIDTLKFPLAQASPTEVWLQQEAQEELEEVVITATRGSRTIDNIPTRVEVIAGEELEKRAI